MSFEANRYPISTIMMNAIFQIPRNQRRYKWEEENWNDLYDDIIFSISAKKSHFIGSIVLEKINEKNGLTYYKVIDGQQRLITITTALIAIMKLLYENEMDNDFLGTKSYLQSTDNRNNSIINIDSDYHLSLKKIIDSVIQLSDRKISITAFLNINTVSKQKDTKIIKAIKYFYSTIKDEIDKSSDGKESLIMIRNALLDMTVVKIVSDSEEDSYTIFEILNARGQELEPYELIKNYIMRYIYPEETRDIAKLKWEQMENDLGSQMKNFISHYVVHKFSVSQKEKINPYHIIKNNSKGKNISLLLDDILLKCKYYCKLIDPKTGEEGNCEKYEAKIFDFLKKKKFIQFRPIFLSIIHQNELETISNEKYKLLVKYLYNFFVCYSIIGEEKSNKLTDDVRKFAPILENSFSEDTLQQFCVSIKNKLPGYDWFFNVFKNVGWSKHFDLYKGEKNKQRVQIILEIVESYVSQSECKDVFTIEHMKPDNESIENSQIGNLIPLEEHYNHQCGDKQLSQKYEIYSKSNFTSTRNIANRYKGKEFDPNKRTEFLARLIYNNILELNQFDFSND